MIGRPPIVRPAAPGARARPVARTVARRRAAIATVAATIAAVLTAPPVTARQDATSLADALAGPGTAEPVRLRTGRLEDGSFDKIYEPSGVASLSDGTLVVIEDEPRRPLRRVEIAPDALDAGEAGEPSSVAFRIVDERRLKAAKGRAAGVDVGELDDLEGIARDASDRLFVVGSHDDGARRGSDRRKLVRFAVRDGRRVDAVMTRRLRDDLLDVHPEIAARIARGGRTDGALNIEALAFDRRRGHLLIGLRTPRLGKDAVIARLTNPHAYVEGREAARFARPLWTVDLDKGGLRAMSYDDRSDQLLMVSRRESGKGGPWKLWRLAADGRSAPVRLRLPEADDAFEDVEGLVPLGDLERVLFVRDDGDRDERDEGGWFTVSRARLGID